MIQDRGDNTSSSVERQKNNHNEGVAILPDEERREIGVVLCSRDPASRYDQVRNIQKRHNLKERDSLCC